MSAGIVVARTIFFLVIVVYSCSLLSCLLLVTTSTVLAAGVGEELTVVSVPTLSLLVPTVLSPPWLIMP